MSNSIDYHSLFGGEKSLSLTELTQELEDLLTVHPAPQGYRERLRGQLMAMARDERFYRRGVRRRLLVAMSVVLTVLISVVGLIVLRSFDQRARRMIT